jgi:hypothetical protein
MLQELDFPVNGWSGAAAELQLKFAALCQPVADALLSSAGPAISGPGYAVLQNLSRALNDSVAGFHLAQHGFLNQANNVTRTALEACDLAVLFAQHPEQAEAWHATDKAHQEFSPSKVRKLLGKPPYDEIHGWLSETGSHSRSVGAHLMGGGIRVMVDENGDPVQGALPEAEIIIGPYAVRASIAFGCGWPGYTVSQAAINLSALTLAELKYSERDWLGTMREVNRCRGVFAAALILELKNAGVQGAEDLIEHFEDQTDLLDEYEAELNSSK